MTGTRRARLAAAAAAVAVLGGGAALTACGAGAGDAEPRAQAPAGCTPRAEGASPARVRQALHARRDLWGEQLLAARGGPTYEQARRLLAPILLARAPRRTSLTASGFHYVAFGLPRGDAGTSDVALHVADGSQIVTRRVGGRSLTVLVGVGGRERYGSCRSRLRLPRLAEGWLPILITRYVDRAGVRYEQESFAARVPGDGPLVSFVRLAVDARTARADGVRVRFAPEGNAVGVARGTRRTIYFASPHDANSRRRLTDEAAYGAARRSVAEYWRAQLARGAQLTVPERRVVDARRALLVQNLTLAWRYSVGNAYEEFSFPEGVDVAQVLGEQGFADVDRAIMRTSLTRRPTPYPNWKRGEKLLGTAAYYALFRDRGYVAEVTPILHGYVAELGRQLEASRLSLLERDRYSSDIEDPVYGLHAQAVVWQGLRAMSRVWAETGDVELAARAARFATRLEGGLRRAVHASARRLPDGSLFVPVRLLDPERPYGTVTEARSGSYWNLVMPYALASGLFPPGSPEATGIFRYMQNHGSRLLGLVRAGAYALYGRSAYPRTGTDQVYGNNVSRFLADNDEADQLVLTLYGSLAAAMAPGTYVAGEAASVAPLGDSPYRSAYLPPNGAANAAFLETLRLMLVHETRRRDGAPSGLELAYATPRAWLRPGRRIEVQRVPTSFGLVSFALEARADHVRARVAVPRRTPPPALRLRVRLPAGRRMTGVVVDGRRHRRFDPATQVVELSGSAGQLELVVRHAPR